jgi:hypothetical protein
MMNKPPKHILSKTTFLYGCQCQKRLWLHKFRSHLRSAPDAFTQARWKRGHDVGKDAQQLFPGGMDMTPASPSQYPKAVQATATAIADGINVIYEATFQYRGVLIMLDILVRHADGWYGYEVKSSLDAKAIHIHDLALQSWVMWGAGLHLQKVHLIHLNPGYVRGNTLNRQELFSIRDLTDEVLTWQPMIGEQVERELSWLQSPDEPIIATGDHCWAPYACDFAAYCGAEEPLIPDPAPPPALSDCTCFVHLATVRPAVPLFAGQSPFQHIPYALSFIQVNNNESPKQQNYLAPQWPVREEELVATFIQATATATSIAVDASSALPRLITQWKQRYPEYYTALAGSEQKLVRTELWINDDHPQLLETKYGSWLRERNTEQKRFIEKQLRAHGIDLAQKIKALFLP